MPCHLEYTDAAFVFAGKSYADVPLLVDSDYRFVEPVCDYLRCLITYDRLKTTSVKTYAEYLLHFWRFLETRRIRFDEVTDHDLIRWLNQQELDGVGSLTQSARCDEVFHFYVWLEIHGYVHQSVRIPGHNDSDRFTPKLTSVPLKGNRYNRRASKFGIVAAVRPRATHARSQSTPTAGEITRIYIAAENPGNARLTERNQLLIDWYVQVGVRRKEWSSLSVSQIPDWDTIDDLRRRNHSHELRLIHTKGGRPRHVGVLPELLDKTREYIEGPREDIVKQFKKRHGALYRQPAEIFLSEKTGLALNLTAVSNLLTGWFKAAGIKSHGHRLRATYLTHLFEAELAAEEARLTTHRGDKVSIDYELILRKVAERAGHVNIDSLRTYLTLAKKRRARDPGDVDIVTLKQQIDAGLQQLALINHQLELKAGVLNSGTASPIDERQSHRVQ